MTHIPSLFRRRPIAALCAALALPALALVSLTPGATLPAQSSRDVPADRSDAAAIADVQRRGVMTGDPRGTFRPDDPINRAEVAAIIVRAAGIEPCQGPSRVFPDIAPGAWYTDVICAAHARGIVAGYPDGLFRPERTVNAAEIGKLLAGSFGVPLRPQEPGEPWYGPSWEALVLLGMHPPTIRSASQEVTRGEVAWMLSAILSLVHSDEAHGAAPVSPGVSGASGDALSQSVLQAQERLLEQLRNDAEFRRIRELSRPARSASSEAAGHASSASALPFFAFGPAGQSSSSRSAFPWPQSSRPSSPASSSRSSSVPAVPPPSSSSLPRYRCWLSDKYFQVSNDGTFVISEEAEARPTVPGTLPVAGVHWPATIFHKSGEIRMPPIDADGDRQYMGRRVFLSADGQKIAGQGPAPFIRSSHTEGIVFSYSWGNDSSTFMASRIEPTAMTADGGVAMGISRGVNFDIDVVLMDTNSTEAALVDTIQEQDMAGARSYALSPDGVVVEYGSAVSDGWTQQKRSIRAQDIAWLLPEMSDGGGIFAFGYGNGGEPRVFDVAQGAVESMRSVGHPSAVYFPRISRDGRYVAYRTNSSPQRIMVYDRETGQHRMIAETPYEYTPFDISPDGNTVAVFDYPASTLRFFKPDGTKVRSMPIECDPDAFPDVTERNGI